MTKPTKIALGLIAGLVIGGAIVASSGKMQMPFVIPKISTPNSTTSIGSIDTTPTKGTPSDLPILADHMPAFQGITKWWNTPDEQPLTPEKLKGKVVLIDFWTYSCINCIRTFPFIKTMHERYADKGLVIVGVHTPEFAFEADPANVGREIEKNGFKHPIALDPSYATWNAYSNHYWPAEYLFDAQGRLRHVHFGEGAYDEGEAAIRSLLTEAGANLSSAGSAVASPNLSMIETRETYFGLARGDAFMGTPGKDGTDVQLTAATNVSADKWTAGGTWMFKSEYIQANSANAVFRFNVEAAKLHIVMESADGTDKQLEVYVDGKKTVDLIVNKSTLYTISEFPNGGRHTVEIRLKESGVRFYAATFS
jgi:thiol-disulfide isomerase/thioredoxin